jgi:hypothetical protein
VLQAIPAAIMALTGLTLLSARRNRLRALPPECGMLTSLARLLLSDNHLSVIPMSIGRAPNLNEVDLSNNAAWVCPPAELVDQGGAAVVSYLGRYGGAFKDGRLNLTSFRLTAFPEDVFNFETDFAPLAPHPLVAVSLADNKLAQLPDRVAVRPPPPPPPRGTRPPPPDRGAARPPPPAPPWLTHPSGVPANKAVRGAGAPARADRRGAAPWMRRSSAGHWRSWTWRTTNWRRSRKVCASSRGCAR